jgi:glycosyltransferase involved in cell wall biosynthesis
VTQAIHEEYRLAEAFVIPSRYEAFGLVTAEAMSHGLPVVGFADCPGTNELIDHARTGLLVMPGKDRIRSLAIVLSDLLGDPTLRRRLGEAGRQAIDDRFSPKYIGDLWESLLRSVSGPAASYPASNKRAR